MCVLYTPKHGISLDHVVEDWEIHKHTYPFTAYTNQTKFCQHSIGIQLKLEINCLYGQNYQTTKF